MRLIPVIDLKDGLVVRGIAGRREEYRPIVSQLVSEPTPQAVATAFVNQFGFGEVYVADLDAIGGKSPSVDAYQAIASAGLKLWIDAGIGTEQAARRFEADTTIIMGLESLDSPAELEGVIRQRGADRLIFSLDLKSGRPLTKIESWQRSPFEIADAAVGLGVRRLIVLDLADVGVGGGISTLELIGQLRAAHPELELIAGGGVRGLADLQQMAAAGCDAALVASALHDGRITANEVRWLERPGSTTLH
jgi:phosphoribosylformimino-5-aminoimidazole carboxamide ribotide isomerase